eukprot:m.87146 g.87146  ORF g.87146 m.87146 type:complete len:477 (+) comp26038_c0_seq2:401-1831(+)
MSDPVVSNDNVGNEVSTKQPKTLDFLMLSVVGLPSTMQKQPEGKVGAPSASEFVSTVVAQADELGQLFKLVPATHKRRTDALKGALQIKGSSKKIAATDTTNEANTEANLVEYQAALRDYVLGLLELSNPIDETATDDMTAAASAIQRLDSAASTVELLEQMFQDANVDPAPTSEPVEDTNQSIPPELLAMLTKKMGGLKPKVEENNVETSKQAKTKAWEKSAGRLSCVVGKEIWEALCWRQAIVRFFVVKDICTKADVEANTPENLATMDTAIQRFAAMIWSQGPVGSDTDELEKWQKMSDAGMADETQRMFYHGIYSSVHLRALKHQAELCYWRWKYFAKDDRDCAELAALINRKFVHIVRHIMPGAGWTADIEFERIVEIETETLKTSAFSIDLEDLTSKQLRQKGKPQQTTSQPKIEEIEQPEAIVSENKIGEDGNDDGDDNTDTDNTTANVSDDGVKTSQPKKKNNKKKKK